MSKAKKEKSTGEVFLLTPEMSVEQGLAAVQEGKVTQAQFNEWLVAREKTRPVAAPKGTKRAGCEITRKEFFDKAKPLSLKVGKNELSAAVKQFKSAPGDFGSFGWFTSGKVPLEVDGKTVTAQMSINITVVNSKTQEK